LLEAEADTGNSACTRIKKGGTETEWVMAKASSVGEPMESDKKKGGPDGRIEANDVERENSGLAKLTSYNDLNKSC
jgi:hypothetical protein